MKRFKSRLAIILSLMVFATSFSFIGVFAEGNEPAAEVQTVTVATTDSTTTVSALSGLTAYASYNSVVLTWNASTVTTGSGESTTTTSAYYKVNDVAVGTATSYTWSGLEPGVDTTFTVTPYTDETYATAGTSATVTKAAVRTIAYRLKIKTSGKLKSHGGPKQTIKVKKGQYIDAYGFGGGKYIFNYNGSIFYCNKTRTSKRTCIYNSAMSYSREEAQYFVNAKGCSSKTGWLIWVNTYTQHIFIFTGSAGNWTCVNDFKCSTGSASTPSPTGVSGNKTIWKKIKKRHGIKWWSPYSDINSIHSKKAKWKIGKPSSNGCIRNYEANAKYIYQNCGIGTRVYIY